MGCSSLNWPAAQGGDGWARDRAWLPSPCLCRECWWALCRVLRALTIPQPCTGCRSHPGVQLERQLPSPCPPLGWLSGRLPAGLRGRCREARPAVVWHKSLPSPRPPAPREGAAGAGGTGRSGLGVPAGTAAADQGCQAVSCEMCHLRVGVSTVDAARAAESPRSHSSWPLVGYTGVGHKHTAPSARWGQGMEPPSPGAGGSPGEWHASEVQVV